MSARPLVSVRDPSKGVTSQVQMPSVLLAPIRPDIVQFVHTNMRKNARQAYAVKPMAGHGHSAHSWGTGRAVSRIPRVSGSGNGRSGQAAFGNMCRKGHMFAPTKIWRKWNRKINTNQKRYAVASALAASALPALVMARGHRVGKVAEVPLVLDARVESLKKTKDAIQVLKAVNAWADVLKVKRTKKLRAGKGKLRDRRHVQRKGPLVVYNSDEGIVKAMRNLPGVELCHVERLNLLQLAPGAHLGRFIIWTAPAFARLDELYGSESTKKNYVLPRNVMTNADIARIINSDEVQSTVRPAVTLRNRRRTKKNPLKNLGALVRLNPYALTMRRNELRQQERRAEARAAVVEAKRNGVKVTKSVSEAQSKGKKAHRDAKKAFYQSLIQ